MSVARLLYAWEWGAGHSHLRRFMPFAAWLQERQVQVTVASRDLTYARHCYPSPSVQLFQAPTLVVPSSPVHRDPRTLASIARNLGYTDPVRVGAWFDAWTSIVRSSSPDIIVADFGIMPLVVAYALGVSVLRIGTGFECPPARQPLGRFGPLPMDEASESLAEAELLACINHTLLSRGYAELPSLAQVIPAEEETLLCTVPALDPYFKVRNNPNYLGLCDAPLSAPAQWPGIAARRAVAYLKPFANIEALFRAFAAAGVEIALIPDQFPPRLLHALQHPMLCVQQGLIDFAAAARASDVAITNGNHGTSLTALQNGTPVLACSHYIEQRLTGETIQQLGLGMHIDTRYAANLPEIISRLLSNPKLRANCQRFQTEQRALERPSIEKIRDDFLRRVLGVPT